MLCTNCNSGKYVLATIGKGGLISESFSLWSKSQNHDTEHYPPQGRDLEI